MTGIPGWLHSSNHPYTDIQSTWVVPSATGAKNAWMSQWVGIGLGSSTTYPLVQAGVEIGPSSEDYFWIEVFPQQVEQPRKFSEMPVFHGNLVRVQVHFSATTASFRLQNLTLGYDRTYSESFANTHADGHAEWIVERPGVGNGHAPLANFGITNFTNSYAAYDPTWRLMGTQPIVPENMKPAGGRLLAYTHPMSSPGHFAVDWRAAS